MHSAVIEEVREKTPTPVFKKVGDPTSSALYLKFMKGDLKESTGGTSGSGKKIKEKVPAIKAVSSKISDSGKRQKVKEHKESARQSKIYNYYVNRQLKNCDFKEYQKSLVDSNKRLGFATPAQGLASAPPNEDFKEARTTPKKESAKRVGIQQKAKDLLEQHSIRRTIIEQDLQQVTKVISKNKKSSAGRVPKISK